MKKDEIAAYIIKRRKHKSIVCPSFTPNNWSECDVFEYTRQGFFHEYEIKTSREDFKKDANKSSKIPIMGPLGIGDDRSEISKHLLVSTGFVFAPRRFWFVVPDGLIGVEDIPGWAGLIYAVRDEESKEIKEKVIKSAPSLHRHKNRSEDADTVKKNAYFRMNDYFVKLYTARK